MFGEKINTIELLEEVAKRFIPSNEVYPLGIDDFDYSMDGGIRGGELIVVSGQTGSGKTLYCQTLSVNLSKKGVPSLWFSFEMNPYYLLKKFKQMCKDDLYIYSPIDLIQNSIEFIDQEIKEATEEKACKIIFIDHLHYLIPLNQTLNSSLLIGAVVRELKKIAIKRDVIIFLIAHTKKIYQDERLELSSIRDSGIIACEADYVFLIERLKKEQKVLDKRGTEWTNQTKISLAKNRRTGKMIYITCNYQENKLIPIEFKNYEQSI